MLHFEADKLSNSGGAIWLSTVLFWTCLFSPVLDYVHYYKQLKNWSSGAYDADDLYRTENLGSCAPSFYRFLGSNFSLMHSYTLVICLLLHICGVLCM